MKERIPCMPGPLSRVLCILTAFVLTVALTGGVLALLADRVLFDTSFNEAIALDDAVVDAQYARIGAAVDALAEKNPFEPATVMTLIDREAVEAYGRTAVAWWMGLLKADPELTLPSFTVEGLVDAVREDETFQAGTPSTSRKTVARDKIAAGATRAVEDAVVPLRTALISFGFKQVVASHDVAGMAAKLPYVPVALFGLSLVLALLMLAFTHKRMSKGLLYIGSAMAATALTLVGAAVMVALLNVPTLVATVSELPAMQARLLLSRLGLELGLMALALFVGGLALIGVHQHNMRRIMQTLQRAGLDA